MSFTPQIFFGHLSSSADVPGRNDSRDGATFAVPTLEPTRSPCPAINLLANHQFVE